MTENQLRLSDSERDAAAADLGEHFAQGRLSVEEHSERLDRIWAARTRGEIAPIFRDLPSPYAASAPRPFGPTTGRSMNARRRFPVPLVAIVAALVVLTALTKLPIIVFGLAAWVFVSMKHRTRHPRPSRH